MAENQRTIVNFAGTNDYATTCGTLAAGTSRLKIILPTIVLRDTSGTMNFYNTDVASFNPLAFGFLIIWMLLILFGTLPLTGYTERLKQSRSKSRQKMGRLVDWILYPAFVVISLIAITIWNLSSING